MREAEFFNPYRLGFARLVVAVPRNRVAGPAFNARETVALYRQADAQGAALVAFPELGLSAYTCDDLFYQAALRAVIEASRSLAAVAVVGPPLRVDHRLFNCAAVISGGRLLGVTPKTYLTNYGEFYESRQFSAANSALTTEVTVCGQRPPSAADLCSRLGSCRS